MIQILIGLVLASCHVFYKLVIFGNFNTVLAITERGLQLLFLSGVFISLKNIIPVLSLDFYPVNRLYYIFLMCCRSVSFINTFVFSFYVSRPHVYMMFLFIDPNSKAVVFVAQFFKDHPNALLGFISLLIALYVFIVFKTGVLNILFMCFFPKYSAVGLKRYGPIRL